MTKDLLNNTDCIYYSEHFYPEENQTESNCSHPTCGWDNRPCHINCPYYKTKERKTTMPKQTKAQLQQEILDLQQQIKDLNTTVTRLTNNYNILKEQLKPHMIAQAIQPNNPPAKQEQHTYQPVHTDGINNSDERVREPIHEMEPIAKAPNPPSYKQLSKLAYYYATYKLPLELINKHKPINDLEAGFLLTDIHDYVNSIPYEDRPFNDYQLKAGKPDPNQATPKPLLKQLTKDELMAARQFKQQATLCYLIAKYGSFTSCKLPFCEEFNITEDTYTILINKQTEKLQAFHTQQRQADNDNM